METIQRLTLRFFPRTAFTPKAPLLTRPALWPRKPAFRPVITPLRRSHSSGFAPRAGWLLGMRQKKNALPDIVKAGDPVLHEPAQEVRPEEIGSERIQKIIDDMVKVMRKAPGVGLAAPQIGIPFRVSIFPPLILLAPFLFLLGTGDKKNALPDIVKAGDPVLHEPAEEVRPEEIGSDRIQNIIVDMVKVMRNVLGGVGLAAPQIGIPFRIIVLEDTKEYISFASKQETKEQDRRPFDLLVVINPKLEKKGNRTAFFFEGCLSVDGFRAVVERHLEVEVSGFDRDGQAIKVNASGWQARIFQHECDHLEGTIYVDKMVPRTFRTVSNLDLPLAIGCPKVSVR